MRTKFFPSSDAVWLIPIMPRPGLGRREGPSRLRRPPHFFLSPFLSANGVSKHYVNSAEESERACSQATSCGTYLRLERIPFVATL